MDINDFKDICDILYELQNEFDTEEAKLKDISKDRALRIDELEQQIYLARKNEDIDFRVFSPRNISKDNSEKINALEDEKAILEKEKKNADRQMYYYSGKSEKLEKAIRILKKNMNIDSNENINNSKPDVIKEEEFDVMSLFSDEADSLPESFERVINESNNDNINYELSDEDNEEISDIRALFNDHVDSEDININKDFNKESKIVDSNEAVSINPNNELEKKNDEITDANKEDVSDNKNNELVESGHSFDSEYFIKFKEQLERLCHKAELTEKIINNDKVRAKIQIKNIISDIKDIIKSLSKD